LGTLMYQEQIAKYQNVVCLFAQKYKAKTKRDLVKTSLCKFLAFFQYDLIQVTGKPALALEFLAMEQGPVPPRVLEEAAHLENNTKYKWIEKNGYTYVIPTSSPNLSYLSQREQEEIDKLIEIFADASITTSHMSDASHEQIIPWQTAWKRAQTKGKKAEPMRFRDVFGNIDEKAEDDLTPEEEGLLAYEALTGNRI